MELLKNPFYVLAASPRDNRRRIMELAEERSLFLDAEECAEARSVLTNPRRRLAAELSWLPSLAPGRVEELIRQVTESPESLLSDTSIPSLARVNLLVAGLAHAKNLTAEDMSKWILAISDEYETIYADDVLTMVNAERVAAGFPEIAELSLIEEELAACCTGYRTAIRDVLDTLPSKELVRAVTLAVEEDTSWGEASVSTIIADLVDAYEVEVQAFLEREEENMDRLISSVKTGLAEHVAEDRLKATLDCLSDVVRNWDMVAQPVQVLARSRGLNHEASQRVAKKLRELGLVVFHVHDNIEIAQQIVSLIRKVFAEVDKVAERADEDASALDKIQERRTQNRNWDETFRKEITFETEIGLLFKKRFRISPEGVEWDGRCYSLDSIIRLRWGGKRHSVNFIPTGTSYSISFGTAKELRVITLDQYHLYTEIIERLWKAVGVGLMIHTIQGLREGREYHFGTAILCNGGMALQNVRLFGQNDYRFCTWNELSIWSDSGYFYIASTEDKNYRAALSYQQDDNVFMLETAIHLVFDNGYSRLSEFLDQ